MTKKFPDLNNDGEVTQADVLKGRGVYKKGGKVGDKWIQEAIKKPGALKKSLGVKKGEKIPAKKLESAAKKPGKMGQRARLAPDLKGVQKVIDFVQKQLEASERLFNVMMQDHKERIHQTVVWADMNAGLLKKLEERDAIIEELRAKLAQYETSERL